MPEILHFVTESRLQASPEAVFAFHEREDAIRLLTPPWQPMRVLRRDAGLQAGSEVEFRVWLGPVPMRWLARHTACTPPYGFVDIQVRGPFAHWRHEHRFMPQDDGTLLADVVKFRLPGAPLMHWLFGWAVRLQLRMMFAYRHRVTRRYCERPTSVPGSNPAA